MRDELTGGCQILTQPRTIKRTRRRSVSRVCRARTNLRLDAHQRPRERRKLTTRAGRRDQICECDSIAMPSMLTLHPGLFPALDLITIRVPRRGHVRTASLTSSVGSLSHET